MKVINRKELVPLAVIGVAGLAYITVLPSQYRIGCPIHAVTGLWCPGCGDTRAAIALLNGDIQLAAHYNVFLVTSPLLLLIAFLIAKSKHAKKLMRAYVIVLAVAITIFTIARNLPGSPIAPL